ncbi:hypothetical protein BDR26DRAFT_578272 [Obelidium mucronatum]|nr:hypothetical protein BDR26DRAFT_578272 [Obelidium mucronatum]
MNAGGMPMYYPQQQQQQQLYPYPMAAYPQQPQQQQQYQPYPQQQPQLVQQYPMQYQQGYPAPQNQVPLIYHSNQQIPIPSPMQMPMQMPLRPQAAPYPMQPQAYQGPYAGYPMGQPQMIQQPPTRSSSQMHQQAQMQQQQQQQNYQQQQQQYQRLPPAANGLALQPKQLPPQKPFPNSPSTAKPPGRTPSPSQQVASQNASGVPISRIKSRSPSVASMFERPTHGGKSKNNGQQRKQEDDDNASISSTTSTKSFSGFMSGFKRGIMRGIGLNEGRSESASSIDRVAEHSSNGASNASIGTVAEVEGQPKGELSRDAATRIQQQHQQGMVRGIYPGESPVVLQQPKYPGPPPGFLSANSFGPPPPVVPVPFVGPMPMQYPGAPNVHHVNVLPTKNPPFVRPPVDFSRPPPPFVAPNSAASALVDPIPQFLAESSTQPALFATPVYRPPSPPQDILPKEDNVVAAESREVETPQEATKSVGLPNRFSFDGRESIEARPVAVKPKSSQLSIGVLSVSPEPAVSSEQVEKPQETVSLVEAEPLSAKDAAADGEATSDVLAAAQDRVLVTRSASRQAINRSLQRRYVEPEDVSPSLHQSLLARTNSLLNSYPADSSVGLPASPHRSPSIGGQSGSTTRSLDRSMGRGKKPLSANGTISRSPLPPSPTPGSNNFIQNIMHEDVLQTHRDVSHLFWVDDAVVGPDVHPAKLLADAESAVAAGGHPDDHPDFGSLMRKRSIVEHVVSHTLVQGNVCCDYGRGC